MICDLLFVLFFPHLSLISSAIYVGKDIYVSIKVELEIIEK